MQTQVDFCFTQLTNSVACEACIATCFKTTYVNRVDGVRFLLLILVVFWNFVVVHDAQVDVYTFAARRISSVVDTKSISSYKIHGE